MLPFVEPDRKRRDEDASFEQHIEGDISHIQLGGQEALMLAAQEHSNVRIAVRAMRATRTAAIDDGPRHVVATGDQSEEAADCFLRVTVDAIYTNPTMKSGFVNNPGLKAGAFRYMQE